MRRVACAALLTLCSVAQAQTDPLFVRTTDNHCWFDQVSQYRITYTEHHLAFNETTGLYYVEVGCFGQTFGTGTDQAIRTYAAVVDQDPCADVDSVLFQILNPNAYDTGCGSWQPQTTIELGPLAIIDVPGNGIQLQPQGAVGGTGITYRTEWDTPYNYRRLAIASGPSAGGIEIVIEQGQLLSDIQGNSCSKCAALLPKDPPPPPPPPPPVPPNNGGGGPNGETGPEYPGGPDNPEGPVCCQFEDGTNQEMSYNQCDAQGGVFWYPAPCEEPIGCCTFFDIQSGEFISGSTTQAECVVLEGTWTPEPCEDDCADCCEAIRVLLESFTDDVQVPLRDWLLEDWPDFSTRVLAVLEEGQDPEPDPQPVDPNDVDGAIGDAGTFAEGLTIPDGSTSGTEWTFDVLGTSQTFNITLDPRNWPQDAMHNTLAAFIVLMRSALAIGLTIMFGSMVARVLRQW